MEPRKQMTISEVIEQLTLHQRHFGDLPIKFLDADMGYDIEFENILAKSYDREGVREIQISFQIF